MTVTCAHLNGSDLRGDPFGHCVGFQNTTMPARKVTPDRGLNPHLKSYPGNGTIVQLLPGR